MKKYLLSSSDLAVIQEKAKKCRYDSGEKLRLLCIYWAGAGKSCKWIEDTLFIKERTIYKYLEEYHDNKKTKNLPQNGGRPSSLSKKQEQELISHLKENIYPSTVQIVTYIEKQYGICYSRGGLSKWLLRNNFRYKRPRLVPNTVSIEKQEAFIESYQKLKKDLQDDEVILFMDGVHPDHQTQNVHGWIERSMIAQVPSTGKQKRVHYIGAVNVNKERVDHVIKKYTTINSEAIKDFLLEVSKNYPGKKLKIICDRGAYHTSKETKNFVLDNKHIKLIYLPPRCPNLNLIERLWKIMREHVTYNKYYQHFKDFEDAVSYFFEIKIGTLQDILLRRLRDNFYVIKPYFLQSIS